MAQGGSLAVFEHPILQGITSCLRMAGEGVSELLWPTRCVLCDVPGKLLCDECRLELPYIDPLQACPFCGQAHGKFACVDCNSFIVKHRGLTPDQYDPIGGEHDVSREILSAHTSVSMQTKIGKNPVQTRNVSRNMNVSRHGSRTVRANVSRCEPRKAGQSVSRHEPCGRKEGVSRFEQCMKREGVSRPEQGIEKPLDQIASVFEFIDPCRKLITMYKDHREVRLASVLADLLVDYIDPVWIEPGNTAIVAVPARRQAIHERGFDHMKLVGEKFARFAGLPLIDAIEPNERGDQRGLSASSRQRNMQGSFLPKTSLKITCDLRYRNYGEHPSGDLRVMSHTISHIPARIILVDDVLTTGATLTSAAVTLKQMGARKVFGLTVARLP